MNFRTINRIKILSLSIPVLIFCFILFSNFYIFSFGKNKIYSSVEQVPTQNIALIFGGGMKKDGVTMSDMEEDRVKVGIQLYNAGKVQKLMMTGDDGANNVDEVDAMREYAFRAGVPDEALEIDPHGYNTYKSCYRAYHEYHINKMIAISQTFHLPRILYFCSAQGIEVIGLSANLNEYDVKAKLWTEHLREWLARTKAVLSSVSDRVGNFVF